MIVARGDFMDEILDILLHDESDQKKEDTFDYDFSVELSVMNEIDCQTLRHQIHEINDKSRLLDLIYLNYQTLKAYYSTLEQKKKNLLINLNDHRFYHPEEWTAEVEFEEQKQLLNPHFLMKQLRQLQREIQVLLKQCEHSTLNQQYHFLVEKCQQFEYSLQYYQTMLTDRTIPLNEKIKKSKQLNYQFQNVSFLLHQFYDDLFDQLFHNSLL